MDRVKKNKNRSISSEKKKQNHLLKLCQDPEGGAPWRVSTPKANIPCVFLFSFSFFCVLHCKDHNSSAIKIDVKKKENCLFCKATSGLLSTVISLNHLLSHGNINHFMLHLTAVRLCGLPRLSAPWWSGFESCFCCCFCFLPVTFCCLRERLVFSKMMCGYDISTGLVVHVKLFVQKKLRRMLCSRQDTLTYQCSNAI